MLRLSHGAPTSLSRVSATRTNASSADSALVTIVSRRARTRRSLGLFCSSAGARQLRRTCTQQSESLTTPLTVESRCW